MYCLVRQPYRVNFIHTGDDNLLNVNYNYVKRYDIQDFKGDEDLNECCLTPSTASAAQQLIKHLKAKDPRTTKVVLSSYDEHTLYVFDYPVNMEASADELVAVAKSVGGVFGPGAVLYNLIKDLKPGSNVQFAEVEGMLIRTPESLYLNTHHSLLNNSLYLLEHNPEACAKLKRSREYASKRKEKKKEKPTVQAFNLTYFADLLAIILGNRVGNKVSLVVTLQLHGDPRQSRQPVREILRAVSKLGSKKLKPEERELASHIANMAVDGRNLCTEFTDTLIWTKKIATHMAESGKAEIPKGLKVVKAEIEKAKEFKP